MTAIQINLCENVKSAVDNFVLYFRLIRLSKYCIFAYLDLL